MAGEEEADRMEQLKAFDETKAGVKAFADAGVHKIPRIFVRPSHELNQDFPVHQKNDQLNLPLIDLTGIDQDIERRKEIVEQVGIAAQLWGFFQAVNHGIPLTVLDGMIEGVRKFNEQDDLDEKEKCYTRDFKKNVGFISNYDLYASKTAIWRDTLRISYSALTDTQELPASCRQSTVDYAEHVKILGVTLLELLSEALGLKPDHLYNMECLKTQLMSCHYYPACPQPELAIGTTKHTDPRFLTILLQNEITSGLQFLYQNQWIDIRPVSGCLVVNIGDFLQLVSNGKFRSNDHRGIATEIGPRISVATFFSGPRSNGPKIYGPIEELISEENPPKYKEIEIGEYLTKFHTSGLDNCHALDHFKA